MIFQHQLVRPFILCYEDFSLAMGSSLGFGSTAYNYGALLTLAFASAPPQNGLTSLYTVTRGLIMQKACGHPGKPGLPHFVSVRFQVLFHSPSRGSFHLSLTVLVRYRSPASI